MKITIPFYLILFILILQGCNPNGQLASEMTTNITNTPNSTYTQTSISSNTPTITITNTPINYYTSLPSVDISNVPTRLSGAADAFTNLTTNEIVYLINLLKQVAKDRDPYPLLDFIVFPMHEFHRCPGDVINTPSEFVDRFSEFMTERTRNNILNLSWDDIGLTWEGLGIAVNSPYDIWFVPYCDNKECAGGYHIVMVAFFGYGTYWDYVEGKPTPKPTYDASRINYGKYKATSSYYDFISHGDLTRLDDKYSAWKEFTLEYDKTYLKMGPFPDKSDKSISNKNDYRICNYEKIEVCQPSEYNKWVWAGEYSLGELLFICNNTYNYRLIILENKRLGYPVEDGYVILDPVK
jgi:hypothetical protein